LIVVGGAALYVGGFAAGGFVATQLAGRATVVEVVALVEEVVAGFVVGAAAFFDLWP
jgi:hypothetical protein